MINSHNTRNAINQSLSYFMCACVHVRKCAFVRVCMCAHKNYARVSDRFSISVQITIDPCHYDCHTIQVSRHYTMIAVIQIHKISCSRLRGRILTLINLTIKLIRILFTRIYSALKTHHFVHYHFSSHTQCPWYLLICVSSPCA